MSLRRQYRSRFSRLCGSLGAIVFVFGVVSAHDTSVRAQATFSASAKPLTEQYTELRQRVSARSSSAEAKRVVFDAFAVIDEACKADDYEMAIRIADLAVQAARKSRGSHLIWLAEQRKEQTKFLAGEYAKLRTISKKVKTNSADSEDCLAFGQFLCLAAGDWRRGLPLLARSDSSLWRNLARMELSPPESAAKQMQLGAAWALVASKEPGDWQQRMEGRAYHWYQHVLRRSSGKEREKVVQLMEQLSFAYLTDMKEEEVRKGAWGLGRYGDRGDGKPITVDGVQYENALGLHPPTAGAASVAFQLNGKCKTFFSSVAISDHNARIRGGVVFQVYGDNRLLWKSRLIQNHGDVDSCQVSVKGVHIFELRTQAVKSDFGLHAAWLDPRVSR